MALEALVEPCPAAPALSTTTTDNPERASSSATDAPMTPAPTTTASAEVFIPRSRAERCRRGPRCRRTQPDVTGSASARLIRRAGPDRDMLESEKDAIAGGNAQRILRI